MSSVDREIRITASDNGVSQTFDRLRAKATETARTIVEAAKKETTTVKEMMDYINSATAQVRTGQAKRYENLIGAETQRYQSDLQRLRTLTPEQRKAQGLPGTEDELTKRFQGRVAQLQKEAAESRKTNELLEKILEATVSTSREEIANNRDQVRRQLRSERDVAEMENDETAMRQMVQRRMLTESEQEEERGPGRGYGLIRGGFNLLRGNPYEAAFHGAEGYMNRRAANTENTLAQRGLLIGGLIAGGAALSIGAASEYFEGLSEMSRVSGLTKGQVQDRYGKISGGFDITEAQALQTAASGYRSSGGLLDSRRDLQALLVGQRGYGLDPNQLGKLADMGSRDSRANPSALLSRMVGLLEDQGLSVARLPELLQFQNELQEKQIQEFGEANPERNLRLISTLLGSGLNLTQAKGTLGTLDSVIQGSNPQVQAAMFSLFQQSGGNSVIDFLAEREKGVSGSLGESLINRLREDTEMSEESKLLTLHSLGFKTRQARALLSGGAGESDVSVTPWSDLLDQATSGEKGLNQIQYVSAGATDALAKFGEAVVTATDKLLSLASALLPGDAKNERKTPKSNYVPRR